MKACAPHPRLTEEQLRDHVDIWFSEFPEVVEVAKHLCGVCPDREECLAENFGEQYGTFGGMTAAERKEYR